MFFLLFLETHNFSYIIRTCKSISELKQYMTGKRAPLLRMAKDKLEQNIKNLTTFEKS